MREPAERIGDERDGEPHRCEAVAQRRAREQSECAEHRVDDRAYVLVEPAKELEADAREFSGREAHERARDRRTVG